jgi:hypothetical protein
MILTRTASAIMHAMVQRPALILLALLVVTACDEMSPRPVPPPRPVEATAQASTEPDTPRTANPAVPPCHQPIEKACETGSCATHDVAVAETKAAANRLGELCFSAGVGTCGDLRFVQLGYGLGSETSYFDASGRMVAAVRTSDAIDPECKGVFTYGRQVRCEPVRTEEYCGGPAAPPRLPATRGKP